MTLSGKNFAITRNEADATEFVKIVESEGGNAIPLPTLQLVARSSKISIDCMGAYASYNPDYTVFMSSKAVRLLFNNAKKNNILDKMRLAVANTTVVSVGPKTSMILEDYKIKVNHMPESIFSSVGIGEIFSYMSRTKNKVLIPRSGASPPFLKDLLVKEGFDVHELYLYDVKPHPGGDAWKRFHTLLQNGKIHGIVFTSVSSVRAFFDIMSGMSPSNVSPLLNNTTIVSIGPFTSEELNKFGVNHNVSAVHTVEGSLNELRLHM